MAVDHCASRAVQGGAKVFDKLAMKAHKIDYFFRNSFILSAIKKATNCELKAARNVIQVLL